MLRFVSHYLLYIGQSVLRKYIIIIELSVPECAIIAYLFEIAWSALLPSYLSTLPMCLLITRAYRLSWLSPGIHSTYVIFYNSVPGKSSCPGPDELQEDGLLQWRIICKQKFIDVYHLIVSCLDFAELPPLLSLFEITPNPEENLEDFAMHSNVHLVRKLGEIPIFKKLVGLGVCIFPETYILSFNVYILTDFLNVGYNWSFV